MPTQHPGMRGSFTRSPLRRGFLPPDISAMNRRTAVLPAPAGGSRRALRVVVLAATALTVVAQLAGPGSAAARSAAGPAAVRAGGGAPPLPAFRVHHGSQGQTDVNACSYAVAPGHVHCDARIRTDAAARQPRAGVAANVTADSANGYAPSYLQAAYNAASGTGGRGQTVAVVDAMDDPRAEADLAAYRNRFGLPACTSANGCFRKVNQSGGGAPPAADAGWAVEISLDLDMVSALCPNCRILLVEANSTSLDDLGPAIDTAVRLRATVVSNSYGTPEVSFENQYDRFYNHPGIAIVASTGDSGYGVHYPAASPYVTAVGGTSLQQQTSGGGRNATETVWSGAGSGCSAYESKPAWQHDSGCAGRTVADVAAVSDPNTGVLLYDSYQNSGYLIGGGTSAAAPIVGALYALAGAPAPGTNPAAYPYANPAALNDITAGNNGNCGSYLCTGSPGYDGPTGLGTPRASAALSAPAPAPQLAPPAQLGTYHPSSPVRVLDTRSPTGTLTNPALSVALPAHQAITVAISGGDSPVPASASAAALNVTVTGASAGGYLSVGPVPSVSTSNLNFSPNQTVPNLVISQLNKGAVSIYNGSAGPVDVIADLEGYDTPDTSGSTYHPTAPVRLLDTRTGAPANPSATSPLAAGSAMTVAVNGGDSPVPAGASAAALNVTATRSQAGGFLSVAPATSSTTSNLNFTRAQTVANLVISRLASGAVSIFNGSGGPVDVIADVQGYETADSTGSAYQPSSPVRLLDTRVGAPTNPTLNTPIPPHGSIIVSIGGGNSPVPPTASAVALNVTVTGAQLGGYLSVAPASSPNTSNLNFGPNQTVPNLVLTQVSGGTVSIYNGSDGTVQVLADVQGFDP